MHSDNLPVTELQSFQELLRGRTLSRMNALHVNVDGQNTKQMADNLLLNFELVEPLASHCGFKSQLNRFSLTEFSLAMSVLQLIALPLCRNDNSPTN